MSNVEMIVDGDFQSKVVEASAEKPVIVKFGATWCGPCRAVAPILSNIAKDRDDLIVVEMDVDESPVTAANHQVQGIPAFVVYRNGEPVANATGAAPKAALLSKLGL